MSDLSNNNLEEEITTLTLDDEFDRKKRYINACGFDDATLRRRDNELKELQKLYPNMCPSLLELAWNFTNYTPKEEQDKIIKEKLWEGKPVKRMMGGIMKNAMSIESRELLIN
jgi:hypothetical protein